MHRGHGMHSSKEEILQGENSSMHLCRYIQYLEGPLLGPVHTSWSGCLQGLMLTHFWFETLKGHLFSSLYSVPDSMCRVMHITWSLHLQVPGIPWSWVTAPSSQVPWTIHNSLVGLWKQSSKDLDTKWKVLSQWRWSQLAILQILMAPSCCSLFTL